MKLLQFAVAELAIIIGVRIEIVELAKFHIFGTGNDAIAIAVHCPEPLGLAELRPFFAALTLVRIVAKGSGSEAHRLKFLQSKAAVPVAVERVERGYVPLLKFGSINAAVPITVKCPQPVSGTEIDGITIPYPVPVRRVDPVPVTQTVVVGRIKPVTGAILHHVT